MYHEQYKQGLVDTRLVIATGCGKEFLYTCSVHTRPSCNVAQRSRLGMDWLNANSTVTGVVPGGVGERLGFRVGDVLLELDHQPCSVPSDRFKVVGDPKGPPHVLTVQRAGAKVDITVPPIPQ